MDSDESDFYVGEHPPNHVPSRAIIMEIGKFEHENDDQEVAISEHKKNKCKILKIANRRGHPNFTFAINGKVYFYGFRSVKADYTMVLQCQKSKCSNSSFILPSEFLKDIIQNTPRYAKNPKCLDKSDPRVYDIKNYDINSFDIGKGHKCPGIELAVDTLHFTLK